MPRTALIVVDVIQTFDFEDGDRLADSVEGIVEPLSELIGRAREEETPIIYVNDVFGHWHSERARLVEQALDGPYGRLIEPIKPPDGAVFVIKARHSIFFGTPLDFLLDQEGIERIVLTGTVTEQCILYSTLDAHIRKRPTIVVRDAVAHIHPDLADAALKMMERNMDADVVAAADLDLTGRGASATGPRRDPM